MQCSNILFKVYIKPSPYKCYKKCCSKLPLIITFYFHNAPLFLCIQAEQSAPFFSKIIPSKFSLELAIYYTCLQLYVTTAILEQPMTNPHPYLHPPVQLVDHVTSHVTSSDDGGHPHVALLRKYQESLDDYTQGEVLLGLGLGEPV